MAKKKKEKRISKEQERDYFLAACKKINRQFKSPISVFAIDPARNNCGWAFYDKKLTFGTITPQPGITSFKKVVVVTDEITKLIDKFGPDFIFMEGYSYGEEFGREQAGETQGCIKYRLFKRNLPLLQPTPHQIKRYIGAAKKEFIMMEVLDKWKMKSGSTHEADAIIQVYIGRALFNLVKYVVKHKLKNTPGLVKEWKNLCKSEGITAYQAEVIYRLIWRQGQMIYL